jgi:hypothetical protein
MEQNKLVIIWLIYFNDNSMIRGLVILSGNALWWPLLLDTYLIEYPHVFPID